MANVLPPDLTKVALSLYEYLDSPASLACYMLVKAKEWDQLASRKTIPAYYLDTVTGANNYARAAQANDFLRKSPLLPVSRDLVKAAEEVFLECEEQCFRTNVYLDSLLRRSIYGDFESPMERRLVEILDKAAKIAKRILGRIPQEIECGFGPGTSYELEGSAYTTLLDKLYTTPTATSACLPLFEWSYWPTLWGRSRLRECLPLPRIGRGNRFTTVLKDALKRRGICIEPMGNLWVQLGCGRALKWKLADVGLHIGKSPYPSNPVERLRTSQPLDGQHHHRMMAREGSMYGGRWATMDLSNASDTKARKLVSWVLPDDWFALLSACRSPYTRFRKTWVRLEKFSSMGNGATFELETLVFAVIVAAACELEVGRDLFVYGDDIILPNEHFEEASAVLRACGFTPNMAKSFATGSFRESCGGDYFEGYSVRSVLADGTFEAPTDWITLHNQLKHRWPRAHRVLRLIVSQVPTQLRLFGPGPLGDRVLHAHRSKWRTWVEHGVTYVAVVKPTLPSLPLSRWSNHLHLAAFLWGGVTGGRWMRVPFRGAPTGYLIDKASVS